MVECTSPPLLRMEDSFGQVFRSRVRRVVELSKDLSSLTIHRPKGACAIDGALFKLLNTTKSITVRGNLCDQGSSRWSFPDSLTHAEFSETDDVNEAIIQLPDKLQYLEITSTPSLELGSLLQRFDSMTHLILRSSSVSLDGLPEGLEVFQISSYEVDLHDEFEDFDLSDTEIKELHFDLDCDFGTIGDIVLPHTLEKLTLNRTCTSEVRQIPNSAHCRISASYPFPELFNNCLLELYDDDTQE
jgi:hypothetical protein